MYLQSFNGYNLSLRFSQANSLTRHPTIRGESKGFLYREGAKTQSCFELLRQEVHEGLCIIDIGNATCAVIPEMHPIANSHTYDYTGALSGICKLNYLEIMVFGPY